MDVRLGLEELESGGEAQALVRPARDRGLPKTCEARNDEKVNRWNVSSFAI